MGKKYPMTVSLQSDTLLCISLLHIVGQQLSERISNSRISGLQTVRSVIARLPLPCLLFWGHESHVYYNDRFSRLLTRYSDKLFNEGVLAQTLLADTWPVIASLVDQVFATDKAMPAIKGMIPFLEEAFDTCDLQPVSDGTGGTCGVLISFVAKEAAGIALDKMEVQRRLYDAITGSTPDLVYVINLDYKFVYANKALLAMWGRTLEQSIGQGLLELGYEPWHAEMHESEIDEVAATKRSIRGEVSFPHATLGERVYDYIFAPIFNERGEVELIAGTTRDISDLKHVEDALKQSEEQFRTLTESMPQLIWTSHPNGYCDFFNRGWYEYTGGSPETSCGDGWVGYVHADHRKGLYNAWLNSLQTGTPLVREFQLKKADGSYQWFYVLGNPIYGQDGTIRKWVGALTNIEWQKTVESKLEKVVTERTRELQRSNEDLLQFAHVASHDLKEPVRKIRTFANRLLEDETSSLSGTGRLFIKKIDNASERMYDMIEGILRYSTMTGIDKDIREIDLNLVLQQIESDLEIKIQERKASIRYSGLPVIEGAPLLIHQLFYNLLNNSLKFVRNEVSPQISITARTMSTKGSPLVKIDVTDNGIGFPQTHAESIFNTFTRLNTKDQFEGTGLGLSLCKKIVERHGGTISAAAAPDKGAVFSVCLPIKQ